MTCLTTWSNFDSILTLTVPICICMCIFIYVHTYCGIATAISIRWISLFWKYFKFNFVIARESELIKRYRKDRLVLCVCAIVLFQALTLCMHQTEARDRSWYKTFQINERTLNERASRRTSVNKSVINVEKVNARKKTKNKINDSIPTIKHMRVSCFVFYATVF